MLVTALSTAADPRADALGGLPLLRVSLEGWIRRVVTVLPSSEGSIQVALPNGGLATPRIPYFPHPQWTVSPDGRVIATVTTNLIGGGQGVLTVTLLNAAGEELYRQRVSFEGVPIPPHVVDSVLRVEVERAFAPEIRRIYEGEARARVPPVYPPVQDLIVANDHRVWIGLRPTPHGRPWLVLDQGGVPVGIVTVPANSSVRAANADHFWAVERDEFDVESVVRYRLD